jgi:hypothetical protein
MPGTPGRDGPAFLAAAAANVLNPPSGQYYVVTHIHLVNQDASARTVNMWVGATGGSADGTEVFEEKSIAANDVFDYYCRMLLNPADFLTGLASAASMVICTIDYEAYVTP